MSYPRILRALSTLQVYFMSDDQTSNAPRGSARPPASADLLEMLDYYLATYATADDALGDTSQLDGFCSALACSPVLIRPEIWIAEIWGSQQSAPEWDSARDATEFHDMLLAFHNHVVQSLGERQFEPLFQEKHIGGKVYEIVHPWCKGFNLGAELWRSQIGSADIEELLTPMAQLGADSPLHISRDELSGLKQSIVPNVRSLFDHFQALRPTTEKHIPAPHQPIFRGNKPGRNDPCPCGSGRKYKKCCLQ